MQMRRAHLGRLGRLASPVATDNDDDPAGVFAEQAHLQEDSHSTRGVVRLG